MKELDRNDLEFVCKDADKKIAKKNSEARGQDEFNTVNGIEKKNREDLLNRKKRRMESRKPDHHNHDYESDSSESDDSNSADNDKQEID